jgi:hypothetical protein
MADDTKGPTLDPIPVLVNAGGVFFVTLSPDDRAGIATTVPRQHLCLRFEVVN